MRFKIFVLLSFLTFVIAKASKNHLPTTFVRNPTITHGFFNIITQLKGQETGSPEIVQGVQQLDTLETEERIEEFIYVIKSFISESSVDFSSFSDIKKELNQNLTMISERINRNFVHNTNIFTKLALARSMFHKFLRSTEDLQGFAIADLQVRYFIQKMVEFDVMTLRFRNSQGHLDLGIHECASKLLRLWNSVTIWVLKFRELRNVPFDFKFKFEDHALDANRALQALVSQVPENERWSF